jgi:MinD superfamily P-loop ATPase
LKIAILSGKGGTGKTTLSVNLFSCINHGTLIDTDAEEPNSHIFIKPINEKLTNIYKKYPVVNKNLCSFCGKCGDYCNFNAIIPTKTKVLVFEDFCHDCGLCEMVCPKEAISYKTKVIGEVFTSKIKNKTFHYGKLKIGEVSGVRVINKLNDISKDDNLVLVDCPPGVSCSTVEAITGSDYAIVCAEPTPFGVSDMTMVVELLREENIDFGVVVNKSGIGNNQIYEYLEKENIELLETIPWTKERATLYSTGNLITDKDPIFKLKMENILHKVLGENYDQ